MAIRTEQRRDPMNRWGTVTVYVDDQGNEYGSMAEAQRAQSQAQPQATAPATPSAGPVATIGSQYGEALRGLSESVMQRFGQPAQEAAAARTADVSATMGQQAGFQQTGLKADQMQADLMGLNGPEAQRAALAMIESSPQFTSLLQQGENAILANAAATGGVRGGNTMAALAQFRPQLLSSLIEQQYGRLAGAAGLGAQVGQGLVGAGVSREEAAGGRAERYAGMGVGLEAGALGQIYGGQMGQLEYDLGLQAAEEDKRRFEESIRQQNADRAAGIITNVFGSAIKAFAPKPPGVGV